MNAELGVVTTSPGCVRYELLVGETRIWSCRVAPGKINDSIARRRMTAWAAAHGVEIDEGFEEVEQQPAQVIIPGRYGRH